MTLKNGDDSFNPTLPYPLKETKNMDRNRKMQQTPDVSSPRLWPLIKTEINEKKCVILCDGHHSISQMTYYLLLETHA